jgi:pimeloyl-ACP methyl ester carboxylesterase
MGRMERSPARPLPVVLVHARAGTAWVWTPLRAALGDAGFSHVVGIDDGCVDAGLDEIAAEVARLSVLAMAVSDAHAVHLVGHGLGGVAVDRLAARGRLAGLTATAVTVASPHRQTFARVPSTRWVSYFTDRDRLVPPSTARLSSRGPDVANHFIPGCGHLSLCRDARLVRSVVRELIRSENPAATGALVGPTAYAQAA